MSRIHLTVSLCGAVLVAGCPGTIDDPAIFEESGQGAGANDGIDAGTPTTRGDAGGAGPSSDASNGGARPIPDAGGGTVACDFKALMQNKCGTAGCHGAPALSTGLDLTSDGLAARVKDKQASGACSDYLIVDPDDPERSALYLTTTDDSCGIRMPLGGTLSSGEQACILQWIENL